MRSRYNSQLAIIYRSVYSRQQYSSSARMYGEKVSVHVPNKKSWPKNQILVALHNSSPMKFEGTQFERISNADTQPGSINLSTIQRANEDAKHVVQFLKNNGGEFFKIDWNKSTELSPGSGDPVAKMVAEQMSEEKDSHPDVAPTEFSVLENLMQSDDTEKLYYAFSDLIKNGTVIPEEIKEKAFAYICHSVLSNKRKEVDQLQSLLSSMKAHNVPVSKFMLAATLRVYLLRRRLVDAASLFDEMSRCGHVLDTKTAELLIHVSERFKELKPAATGASKVMFEERKRSSACIMLHDLFEKEPCAMDNERDVVNVLGKYVSEMKSFTTVSDIDIYTEILRFVGNLRNNRFLIYATLEVLDCLPPSVIKNTDSFRDAMRSANMKGDLVLAKRLLRSALRHKNFMPESFFVHYSQSVTKDPGFQGFFDATPFVHSASLKSTMRMYQDLTHYCVEREWPVALPYLFAIMDPGFRKMESHLPWIEAAIKLSELADQGTLTQIKRIAYTMLHRLKGTSLDFTSALCILFCRCGDKDDVMNFLSLTNRLNESAVFECKSILGPSVNVLNIRDTAANKR